MLAQTTPAQTIGSGGLAGVVSDSSGAVVPGAHAHLKDSSKGTVREATTDNEGRYVFPFLLPARYALTVSKEGFAVASRSFDVELGASATVNVVLQVAPVITPITVTGESPLIQAENGDVSRTIGEREVANVPNPGNDLTYLVQTTAGTVMNTEGGEGNFSSMGVSALSNLFTVNGMYDNLIGPTSGFTGTSGLRLGANQVQEATVVTNGYSGQFGGVAGASVNYITKSGANRFHGNAIYGWNGRVLNANDWINKATGNERTFDNVNEWAASFGGPIKKEKLFFFVDTEGIRLLLPQSFTVGLPSPQFEAVTLANIDARFGASSASDAFYRQMFKLYNATPGISRAMPGTFSDPLGCADFVGPNGLGTTVPCALHLFTSRSRPTEESLGSGRLDWNIRTLDRAFLMVQHNWGRQASYNDPISPLFDLDSDGPWWKWQLNETHAFSANTAQQLLLAAWSFGFRGNPKNTAQTLAAFPTVLRMGAIGTISDLGGLDDSAGFGQSNTQIQVSDDLMKAWRNHKLGFGGIYLREDWTVFFPQDQIGTLTPRTLTAFYQGGIAPGFLSGTDPDPDFTVLRQSFRPGGPKDRYTMAVFGLYGQDEWHPRPTLSLSFALRAEHQGNPTCPRRCLARFSKSFDSLSHDPAIGYDKVIVTNELHAYSSLDPVLWAPRYSFAWQPLGVSHNTVVRGGFGLFYDLALRNIVRYAANNPPLQNSFTASAGNLAPDEVNSLFTNTAASEAVFLSAFASGRTLDQVQAEIPNFSPPAFFNSAGRRTHAARYQKWSLDVQQAIGTRTSISLGYYGNHGIHEIIFNSSVNAYGFGTLPPVLCASPPVPPCADPLFSQVSELATVGISNYHGLIATVQHKFKDGILRANYTWSHGFDEASDGGAGFFTFGSDLQPQDPRNPRGSYGPADYDVRHSLNASYVWELPLKAALRGHGPESLVNGWDVAGTVFARSGFPYTVLDFAEADSLQPNNFSSPLYGVPVGPLTMTSCGKPAAIPNATKPCLPSETFPDGTTNPNAMFVQPGCETGFNSGHVPSPSDPCGGPVVSLAQGRNRFRGPSYFTTDVAVWKNTRLPRYEHVTLGIGVQLFNLLNHPNFALPDNGLPSSTFGQLVGMAAPPTSLLGGPSQTARMIELKARLQF